MRDAGTETAETGNPVQRDTTLYVSSESSERALVFNITSREVNHA
jgi:hypothetical protein